MISYLLAKWRFSRAFEPHGDGFLYRRNARSEAIPLTREEKATFLRDFEGRYWKYHSRLFAGFVAAFLLLVGIEMLIRAGGKVIEGSTYVAVFAFIAASVLIDRRLFDTPQINLQGRTPVTQKGSWLDAQSERISKVSWTSLIVRGCVLVGLAWLTFPDLATVVWVPVVWVCAFTLGFFLWTVNLWLKFKTGNRVQK